MDSSAPKAELIVSVLFVFYYHLVVEKTNSTHYRRHGSANSKIDYEVYETVTSCHTLKMSATNLRLMRLFYEAWSDLFNSSAKADELRGNNSSAAEAKIE